MTTGVGGAAILLGVLAGRLVLRHHELVGEAVVVLVIHARREDRGVHCARVRGA